MAAWCDHFCWSERDEAIDFDGVAFFPMWDGTLAERTESGYAGRSDAPESSSCSVRSASAPAIAVVGALLLHHVDRVIASLDDSPLRAGQAGDLIVLPASSDGTERSAA